MGFCTLFGVEQQCHGPMLAMITHQLSPSTSLQNTILSLLAVHGTERVSLVLPCVPLTWPVRGHLFVLAVCSETCRDEARLLTCCSVCSVHWRIILTFWCLLSRLLQVVVCSVFLTSNCLRWEWKMLSTEQCWQRRFHDSRSIRPAENWRNCLGVSACGGVRACVFVCAWVLEWHVTVRDVGYAIPTWWGDGVAWNIRAVVSHLIGSKCWESKGTMLMQNVSKCQKCFV